MHLLHRSSKRLHFKRHLPRFDVYPLHSRYLDADRARNPFIKRFLGLIEDRIQYQGCPFAQHMHESSHHKSNCSREPLKHSASEVAVEATVSGLVNEASIHAGTEVLKGGLSSDINKICFHEESEAETTSTRTYKWSKQDVIDASTFSKSRQYNTYSSKAYLQNIKRDFHILPEEVSIVYSRVSSSSMNEKRQTISDGDLEGDAEEVPRNNIGDSTEKQVFKPALDNVENSETGLQREDKEVVMSHDASKLFVKDNTSVFDGKNKEENCSELLTFHHDDMALKIAPSSKKKLLCVPQPCYFTVLERKKNKRERKKKKTWGADRQLGPDTLKLLSLQPKRNQIEASGTSSFVQKPRMHGRDLPNYSYIMSRIVTPSVHHESSGQVDSGDIKMDPKESKSNRSEQEVSKQVNCVERADEAVLEDPKESKSNGSELESSKQVNFVERAEEAVPEASGLLNTTKHTEPSKELLCEKSSTKWKEVLKDFGATGEVFSRQMSYTDMELKMHTGSHFHEMTEKGKGTCNENDAFSLYQNREKITVFDNLDLNCRASHSIGACSKGWGAQMETVGMGVNGDLCKGVGASKVHYPLENLNLKDYYLILDLNGVLIKRWGVKPSILDVSKLNKKWIQLRPGCIEFLCKAFSKFKVGIWSTMTHMNVMGVCELLEQKAHQPLPFFMLWSKDSCYQQRGVQRPDNSRVLADFKPLSHAWHLFQPYLGFHNTVLIDDSPYKACMNSPYNCIFPDAYEGSTNDNYLNDVLWPYLEKMRMSQNLQAYIANNRLGQQPIVAGHELYYHVRGVMDVFDYHIHPTGTGELIGKV